MDSTSLATIGANLERDYGKWDGKKVGTIDSYTFTVNGEKQTYTLELVGEKEIPRMDRTMGSKCLAFRDQDGNLYVHFRGTGDGFWGDNAAAYSGEASIVQTQSEEFFNEMIEEYCNGSWEPRGKVYVTGHSQGGNTAQYVTMNSKYGEYIDTCMSLDGPSLSNGLVDAAKEKYGEAYFEMQREKLYACNGKNDYVSQLGQQDIIPKDHVMIIDVTVPEGSSAIMQYHESSGMLQEGSCDLNPLAEEGPTRILVGKMAEKIKELPQGEQARAAELTMKIAEYMLGNDTENRQPLLTEEDKEAFAELLIPILIETLAENEELIDQVMDDFGVDKETAGLISRFIKEFNQLSPEQKEDILKCLAEAGEDLRIDENGKIHYEGNGLAIIGAIGLGLPTLLETIAKEPDKAWQVLEESGMFDKIKKFITDNPVDTVKIIVFAIKNWKPIAVAVGVVVAAVVITFMIQSVYEIIEGIKDLAEEIKKFFANMAQAILDVVNGVKQFLRAHSPGGKYAEERPYFKANTDLLREYSGRLRSLNGRIRSLDHEMDDLYWQVGLLDMWDIVKVNIMTGWSVRVDGARQYCDLVVDVLEEAERKAKECMGG